MPEKMSKSAAARAEKKPKAKTYTQGGIKFNLPATLPETIIFDMVEIDATEGAPMPVYKMLRSILGPEQFNKLRNAIEAGTIKSEDLDTFIEGVFAKYGVTPGEATASQAS